jgi:hypothetical protein
MRRGQPRSRILNSCYCATGSLLDMGDWTRGPEAAAPVTPGLTCSSCRRGNHYARQPAEAGRCESAALGRQYHP